MLTEATEPREIGRLLGHPARKRVIELLGARGPLSWKELSSELGIATGVLYYHIDTLEGLVSRTEDKKYTLTKQGTRLYSTMASNLAAPPEQILASISPAGPAAAIERLFVPRQLIQLLASSPLRASSALVLASVVFLLDMLALGFGVRLYYFFATGLAGAVEGYTISFAAIFVLSYASSVLILRSKPGLPQLAVGCVISFVPVIALASVLSLFPSLGLSKPVSTLLFVFFQTWSACILAAGISVASAVRVEKTLVVGLILLYATMAAIFFF
jgi:DNA-binding transcriptional ArsR family regulator